MVSRILAFERLGFVIHLAEVNEGPAYINGIGHLPLTDNQSLRRTSRNEKAGSGYWLETEDNQLEVQGVG